MKLEVQKQKKTKNYNVKESLIINAKGVTLIALVITIIILLILSGVAIATLTGENGLFARAKQAKVAQTETDMKESLNLAIQELQVEKLAGATLDDIRQEWLTSKLSEYNPILKEDATTNSKKVTLQKNGIIKTYMIDENLNITEVENKIGIDFSYEIVKRENGKVKILIKVQDRENGINKVEVPGDAIILNGTREEKGIDQDIEVGIEYKYKVISTSGKEREETILIEPEIIVGDAYIGTSTTDTNASNSVANNSQTRGTTLYVNFTATLEKFGTSCTVKLKDGTDSDTLPYAITKNGTYTFVATGTYNGKIVEKEIEVKVNKYQAAKNLVKYDAGNWTEDEINELKAQKLYDINKERTIKDATFKLENETGVNFTFGGFTYLNDNAGNTNNKDINEINNNTIITSRNQSLKNNYDGWQILEIKDSDGIIYYNEKDIETKLTNNEKVYITKIIHVGIPEYFAYCNNDSVGPYGAEYLLSKGRRKTEYNKIKGSININLRNFDMYKDKELDKKEYIADVHVMTYDEANRILNNKSIIDNNVAYWLGNVKDNSTLYMIINGRIDWSSIGYYGIRLVVNFNEGVYIAGGDGTEGNEYVLGKD